MVGIAQLVEHLVVVQDVAGSNPVTHPNEALLMYGAPTRDGRLLIAWQPSGGKPQADLVALDDTSIEQIDALGHALTADVLWEPRKRSWQTHLPDIVLPSPVRHWLSAPSRTQSPCRSPGPGASSDRGAARGRRACWYPGRSRPVGRPNNGRKSTQYVLSLARGRVPWRGGNSRGDAAGLVSQTGATARPGTAQAVDAGSGPRPVIPSSEVLPVIGPGDVRGGSSSHLRGDCDPPASRSHHTSCSTVCNTECMTQMVVRIDEATERALAHLMELTGLNKSEVVRKTIQEAERQAIIERVRRQANALREDPKDRAEMLALADEMDSLRAW